MSEEKSIAVVQEPSKAISAFGGNVSDFETGQRLAKALAESELVPNQYRGKVANCLVALEIAHRTGSSVLAVMQNLNIIHGKTSWSAQYIIGSINSSGRYDSPLRFCDAVDGEVTVGSNKVKNLTCYAEAKCKKTGEVLRGPLVSIKTAVAEGWYQKSGSKWPSMPELMLKYRAATFFGRLYCPEILLGMKSEDELRDVGPETSTSIQSVNERIRARKASAESETIEVQVKEADAEEGPIWKDGKQEVVQAPSTADDEPGFY